MIRKRYYKRKKYCYLVFFFFIINLISIVFLPIGAIKENDYENSLGSPKSLIQTSSSSLPNRHYFKYYKVIIIDHSKVSGTGSHENFPILISLLDSDLHDDVQSTGNDIAFADNTGWLDHEIELFEQDYNSTHAKLNVWVRVPSLSTYLDTKISLYYGNTTMSSRENPTGVWNTNYEGVWHLSEEPTGTIYDSTSNNHDGTPQGSMNSADQIDGQIDGSIDFDGTDDYIDMGSSIDIASSSFSVSTWAKRGSSTSADIIFQQGPAGLNTGLHVGFRSNNSFTFAFWADDLDTSLSYTDTDWHHWSCTYDASTKTRKIYRDGVSIASDTASDHFLASNDPFYLGYDGMVSEGFHGQLDESRLLNIALSSGWVSTSYNNQNEPNSFYSIGKEKSVSGHPSNAHYFAYYKEIVVEHSMVYGSNDLLNFSVLISLLDSDLKDHVYSSSGNDIAFAYNTEWLDHELELFNQTYNGTHAQLVAWVRIPILSTSLDTIIRMYYGNSTMGSRENPEGVWDSNYKGVWHLSESTGGTDAIKDSTINGNDGTDYGSPTFGSTGKSDGAIDFKGDIEDEYVQLPANASLNSINEGDYYTYEAWFYPDQVPPGVPLNNNSRRYGIMIKRNPHHGLYYDHDQYFAMEHWLDIGGPSVRAVSSGTYGPGKYYHIVAVVSNLDGYLKLYVNGNLEDQTTWTGGTTPWDYDIGALRIGIANPGWSTYRWSADGKIDEIRISDSARSADWIKTEYKNQNDPSSFYSISKEYPLSGILPNFQYFKYYKEIIIDYTIVSGSYDLTNFPLLISILDSDLKFDVEQANGNDIAFAYNGLWLDHEIELFKQTYNGTHAQLIAWVSIPRLSMSENTIVRMYYGNATMSSRENPEGVWNTNYKGVWHLSEDPTDSSPAFKDSTPNNNDGTDYGSMTSGDQVPGQIDGSLDFDGGDDYIEVNDSSSLTIPGSFTVSAWINTNDLPPDGDLRSVVGKGMSSDNPGENHNYGIMLENAILTAGQAIEVYYEPSTGFGNAVAASWVTSLSLGQWYHVVGVHDAGADTLTLFVNGVQRAQNTGATATPDTGNAPLRIADVNVDIFPNEFNGQIDEVRVLDTVHSADWIKTEYNNQYNPQAFLTIGSEKKLDKTPPTYSNLTESSNPLELGETEIITINVSDPSGINQVKIEFEDSDHVIRNHTMANISGNAWQYDSWTPSSVDNYSYTIWMQDNYDNWNSTSGTIEVIDTTAPTFSDLIESADPLQLGQNETITIKVYDSPGSGVNQVLLEYDSSNHTMINSVGDTWSWSKWKPASPVIYSYTIYMQDMENNWNVTNGNITVVEATGPTIENFTMSEDPLELGNIVTISVDVYDNSSIGTVLIELESANYTMNHTVGNTYECTWTRSWVGTVIYVIYANDTLNNWNSFTGSFDIVDTTVPVIENVIKSDESLELGNTIIISVNSTDLSGINEALIEYEDSYHIIENHTMTNMTGDIWQYDSWSPGPPTGNWSFIIWVKDNNNNWGSVSDSILVQDLTPPMYSDLNESASIVELGSELIISINCTDLAGIKDPGGVLIEYENSNHTMTNIGPDIWQHNSWRPDSIGNYTYKIYITDNNDNLNYVSSSILFQDTVLPTYSNLFESADPLELGDNPTIRIDVYDVADINQVLIEFEGVNYSMTNIYGNTWQYDSWTPTNWIVHQYRIYMEDMSGNWNLLTANITVQDTTPPSSPLFAISPSGDVSGILVFDWVDGSDPSGILYYILIIDNETDHVYIFNITNIDTESSYCELPEELPIGRYYYFLAQIDGLGQQSNYTTGTFTVISIESGPPGNNNFIIIIIIIASVIGSVTAIVIVRKRLKKEIAPPRKKVPLKIITSHLNNLSAPIFDDKQDKLLISKQLTEEQEIEIQVNKIKSLGEELFAEGAYLEAQEQFKLGRDLLLNVGRAEEANLFSELLAGIDGLIEEREKRLELLDQAKIERNAVQIFEIHQDLINISKKLRDPEAASFYQAELINYFQNNNWILVDLEKYRSDMDKEAESLYKNSYFENAAQLYERCEKISQLLVQLEREEEIRSIEEFRYKKNACMKKFDNN
ncbi:MAG: DUF2341 domain-containing protein [Promethearchaeota archaeon]